MLQHRCTCTVSTRSSMNLRDAEGLASIWSIEWSRFYTFLIRVYELELVGCISACIEETSRLLQVKMSMLSKLELDCTQPGSCPRGLCRLMNLDCTETLTRDMVGSSRRRTLNPPLEMVRRFLSNALRYKP